MNWLDESAEKYRKKTEKELEYEQSKERIIANYPEIVRGLWGVFEEFHEKVTEKFEDTKFEFSNQQLTITIGKVSIHGIVFSENANKQYFGMARFHIKKNLRDTYQELHFDRLLLIEENEKPKWVYQIKMGYNDKENIKTFDISDVELIYKKALEHI